MAAEMAAEAEDVVARRTVEVQHHPVDPEDHRVLRERIPPGIELGMPDLGTGQVHHAHASAVVLEGGDLLRVGGPEEDGSVALGPPGVVGPVAEILDPV